MAGVDYESILCVKPTVHVFRIPPRPSNRGYRASDWKLDAPDWTGRLRVVAKGRDLTIKLEDKNSGELFAKCPVEQYPGIAVESVTDSSRYFVLRLMDDNGRSAFIGIGFEDRGDSFDLNVALQDHFKHLKQEKDAEKVELQKGPKLDLGFKEGQTIRINIATKKNTEENNAMKKSRPKPSGGGLGLLPPPPGTGGVKLPPPGGAAASAGLSLGSTNSNQPEKPQTITNTAFPSSNNSFTSNSGSNVDLLLDLDFGNSSQGQTSVGQGQTSVGQGQTSVVQGQTNISQGQSSLSQLGDSEFDLLAGSNENVKAAGGPSDPWGEFTSASNSSTDDNWVQF